MFWIILLLAVKCADAVPVEGGGSCLVGTYSKDFSTTCISCPAGSYMPYNGSIFPMSFEWQGETLYNSPVAAGNWPRYISSCCFSDFRDSFAGLRWALYRKDYTASLLKDGQFQIINEMVPTVNYCIPCGGDTQSLPGSSLCCPPGQFLVRNLCKQCPDGQHYNGTKCTVCDVGKYYVEAIDNCMSCPAGSYGNLSAQSACTQCPIGSFSNLSAQSTCIQCHAGEFSNASGLTVCTSCAAGKYNSGGTTCFDCIAGSTYASSAHSTSCSSCAICNAQYEYSACTVIANTLCCNKDVGVGTYANACEGTANCPALINGTYIYDNSTKLNRCRDIVCDAGTFAYPEDLARSSCEVEGFVLNPRCLNMTCFPMTVCSGGTVLRTPDDLAIINPATNDVQCTSCQPCIPGTVEISRCTESRQTVCAACEDIEWNGTCISYSQIPAGYFPYSLFYAQGLVSTLTNNSVQFPRAQLSQKSDVYVQTLVKCAPLPISMRFKPWTGENKTINCTSLDCKFIPDPCTNTECVGWDVNGGFYADSTGSCIPCPNSSANSTCNAGEFRNLTDCMPDRVQRCFPCTGTRPVNAVWANSKYPHYFPESTDVCEWKCVDGFKTVAQECVACVEPTCSLMEYSYFDGECNVCKTCGVTVPNAEYMSGCNYACVQGYFKLAGSCETCSVCPLGTTETKKCTATSDAVCSKCNTTLIPNSTFLPNCSVVCDTNHVMVDGKCTQCTLNCGVGAWNAAICTAENLGCESIGVGSWAAIGVLGTLGVLASLAKCAEFLSSLQGSTNRDKKAIQVEIDNPGTKP